MGTSKTFTVGFDLADRFTSKFDALFKKIDRITDQSHKIGFDVDSTVGTKLDAIAQKAERTNSAIARSSSKTTDSFNVMGRSLDGLKAKFKGHNGSKQGDRSGENLKGSPGILFLANF